MARFLLPAFFRLRHADFVLPCLIFVLFAAMQMASGMVLRDPDTGWHIAAGEWILSHGAVPFSDVWSYTAGNEQWYNISWLFDVVVAALHRVGGMELLYVLTVIIYPSIAAAIARDALRAGASLRMTFLFFLLCTMPLFTLSAILRPQMVTVCMVYVFIRILSRDMHIASIVRLLWLPLLMIVWVNAHGGFLLAPFIFAAFLFDALWKKDRARQVRILICGAATAAAMLVNPYGWHIYEGVMRTMSSSLLGYIDEWRSADVFATYYLFAILACLFGLRWKQASMQLPQYLLTIVLLLMMIDSARHGLVFAVVATPVLCAGLTQVFRDTRWGHQAEEVQAGDKAWLASPRVYRSIFAAVFAVFCVLAITPARHAILGDRATPLYGKTLPAAIEYINQHYPDIRWINHYNLGGWLIYYGAGRESLFVDGRTETAYPKSVMQDYIDFYMSEGEESRIRNILDHYQVSGIIAATEFERDSVATAGVNPERSGNDFTRKAHQLGWEEVYRNADVALFIRRP